MLSLYFISSHSAYRLVLVFLQSSQDGISTLAVFFKNWIYKYCKNISACIKKDELSCIFSGWNLNIWTIRASSCSVYLDQYLQDSTQVKQTNATAKPPTSPGSRWQQAWLPPRVHGRRIWKRLHPLVLGGLFAHCHGTFDQWPMTDSRAAKGNILTVCRFATDIKRDNPQYNTE